MEKSKLKAFKRDRIKRRVRAKVNGTAEKPRLSVFKSDKHMYAQLIDDDAQKTLAFVSTLSKEVKESTNGERGLVKASAVGKAIAEKAKELGINNMVFDRNGFGYHGRIKAVADGAREIGIKI
jgi:large subunit ribosomal protein L18